MWRLICVASLTVSLLAAFRGAAHAQALAPSGLNLASHDEKSTDEMVQVITEKSAAKTADKPITAITKKRTPVIARKSPKHLKEETTQDIAKESTRATVKDSARTFALEPVRPMNQPTVSTTSKPVSRFSFKSSEGKKESVPVISQYYPKQIVYPFGKVDRHIDGRLMQAASIAQERAHAHSRSRCWHYFKEALLASGVIDSRPKTDLARDAASDLVTNYGFKRLPVTDPFSAPVG